MNPELRDIPGKPKEDISESESHDVEEGLGFC